MAAQISPAPQEVAVADRPQTVEKCHERVQVVFHAQVLSEVQTECLHGVIGSVSAAQVVGISPCGGGDGGGGVSGRVKAYLAERFCTINVCFRACGGGQGRSGKGSFHGFPLIA